MGYTIDEVRPIIPDLLIWLQDMNWPVARPVANYLVTIKEYMTFEILEVLKGDDDLWKYWVLLEFYSEEKPNDLQTIQVLERMANHPTYGEKENDIDQIAKNILVR
jgi:hypothetical protein